MVLKLKSIEFISFFELLCVIVNKKKKIRIKIVVNYDYYEYGNEIDNVDGK